ncbi:MAG: WYL domain-containing protein [Lachnospiraceae bacterium]|nr:WYL domain-containing protein [Lachnospiraceae bacterium]
MAKSADQKRKILYLAEIFKEYTDEEHAITMKDILQKLDENGISAERKSIYDDIETLRVVLGMNIEGTSVGGGYEYRLLNHDFELAELKLLVDAIQSSKFITAKKSNELITKLEKLASRYEAGQLQRQVFVTDRIKAVNEHILYNVDALHVAINSNRKIDFDYYEWNTAKKFELRANGEKRGISPWALVWDNENYYLVAYDSDAESIKHYRVDKMRSIECTHEKRDGKETFDRFNTAVYARKMFGMFGGDEMKVGLLCDNKLVGVIIDRFGTDISIIPQKDCDKFKTTVTVQLSNQFLAWVFSLGGGVQIVSPTEVVEEMKKAAVRLAKQYEI